MARRKKKRGHAVRVTGYSYTRNGKRVTVKGYRRKRPSRR